MEPLQQYVVDQKISTASGRNRRLPVCDKGNDMVSASMGNSFVMYIV